MGDEVLGDLLVAASGQAPGVGHGGVVLGPLGGEDEAEGVREAGGDPGHGVGGADGVGQGGLDPGVLVAAQRGVGEQLLQGAPDAGERARHGAVEALGGDGALGVQVDEPHALAVVGLGEGVGERGAGVADTLAEGLAAVQMAEGDVVRTREDPGGDGGHSPDRDVPFAVARLAAGDEGVGEDDRAGAGRAAGEVGADAVHGGGEDDLVSGLRHRELVLDQGGFEVGKAVEGDVAVVVGEDDGRADGGRVGAQVDARAVDESRADAEAAGRVVVAGDHHGGHAQLGEAVQRVVEQLDGGQRGHRAVVHVSRHHDGVHGPLAHGGDEVTDELGLGTEHVHPVEGPAEMPVGGVQESHGSRD